MKREWWHNLVAYQIYPKSFMDSNGDGIGDLRGIISRLDYLQDLGVDLIWLSPVYSSPFMDQGYDISDYYGIAEEFGSMEDFDELLSEVKKRNMYLIMDLVINHCSTEHEWFKKAVSDPYGPYADYFYFRKAVDGREPSNLRSYFGGNVWELVPGQSDLYYLHMYTPGQPDLNWGNDELRQKLYDMVNWWLDKGIDGFRVDAIMDICKDTSFPTYYEPDGPDGLRFCKVLTEGPGIGPMLDDLRDSCIRPHNAITVGECFGLSGGELEEFIGDNGHFSTIFDFTAHSLIHKHKCWAEVPEFDFNSWRDAIISGQHESMDFGFRANVIENHDEPRGASRYLPTWAQNDAGIKMLGTIHMLLRGIPFIYQGQEIGMQNMPFGDIDEYNDPNTHMEYDLALLEGYSKEEAFQSCLRFSRDNARTPMQWNNSTNSGFTTGTPWLPVNPNYTNINVELENQNPASILNYYKKLIALRKDPALAEALVYGSFQEEYLEEENVFAFRRVSPHLEVLVITNWNRDCVEIPLSNRDSNGTILLTNCLDQNSCHLSDGVITLHPLDAIVLSIKRP